MDLSGPNRCVRVRTVSRTWTWAGRPGAPPLQPDTNNIMLSSELGHRANRSEHYMSCS